MNTTAKTDLKHYSCKGCGFDKEIETNHYGECYSMPDYNMCPDCGHPTVWECQEELPEGMSRPPNWGVGVVIPLNGFRKTT